MINDVSTRFAVSRGAILRRRGFTLVELLICIGLILMLLAILLPAARRSIEAGRQVSCLDHLRQIAHATTLYCMDNDGAFPSAAAIDNWPDSTVARPSDWIYWRRTTGKPPFNDVRKSALARYLGSGNIETVFRCPSDSCDVRPAHSWSAGTDRYLYSYSMNGWVGGSATLSDFLFRRSLRVHDIVNASQIILFVDEDDQSIDDGCWLPTNLSDPSLHNELSIRHDVNHDSTDSSGNGIYDQAGRGNVVFCDGHADFVSRQFSFDAVKVPFNGQPVNYRNHYQPTRQPLPPDVPYPSY